METIILKISELLHLNENQERGVAFLLLGTFLLLGSFLFWRYYKSIGVKKGATLKEAFTYTSYIRSMIGMAMGGLFILIGIILLFL